MVAPVETFTHIYRLIQGAGEGIMQRTQGKGLT